MSGKFVSLRTEYSFAVRTWIAIATTIAGAAAALALPSLSAAQGGANPLTPPHGPLASERITQHANGVYHVAPLAFGVTSAVRDLPTSVPNAAELAAEAKLKEANPFNKKVIKPIIPGAGVADRDFKDPLVDRSRAFTTLPAMPVPSLTFDGASQVDNTAQGIGAVLPLDVNSSVCRCR